jgi:phosphatidylserine/phosphatidylglycerophosphate/cardiolipin synthase-like enzyme
VISLSSTADMLRAMSVARRVTFSSFALFNGPVKKALEDAARRGASVTVRLNGYSYNGGAIPARNRDAVRVLTAAGANARIVHASDTDGPGLHLKAAVCDGVAFLDDRNWLQARDTVIRDDTPSDVRAIRVAASYHRAHCRSVQLDKESALRNECALLRSAAGQGIDVATEEIGFSSVFYALERLASQGAHPRLLISSRALCGKYLTAAQLLTRAGVRVRVSAQSEKFAIAGTKRAWVGSANATSTAHDAAQLDWGMRIRERPIVRALQSRFHNLWNGAAPLPAPHRSVKEARGSGVA